jgi:hypothetical protein
MNVTAPVCIFSTLRRSRLRLARRFSPSESFAFVDQAGLRLYL